MTTVNELAGKLDYPCKGTCSGWQQGYEKGHAAGYEKATKEEGPTGPDRRWKLAAETIFGVKFSTPREMMGAIRALKESKNGF